MSAQQRDLTRLDLTALRTNQALIIILLVLGFVLNSVWPVGVVCLVMALGSLAGVPGFRPVYRYILRPLHIARPDLVYDNPEPHRFAQGFGAAVLAVAVLALLIGSAALGWALVWLVIALAAVNLFLGFCAGCFMYYWLNRLGVPGFSKAPPPNTRPGMRPPHEQEI